MQYILRYFANLNIYFANLNINFAKLKGKIWLKYKIRTEKINLAKFRQYLGIFKNKKRRGLKNIWIKYEETWRNFANFKTEKHSFYCFKNKYFANLISIYCRLASAGMSVWVSTSRDWKCSVSGRSFFPDLIAFRWLARAS